MRLFNEEQFGPIVPITTFTEVDEVSDLNYSNKNVIG
jgi:acyl-CoA reductase-like NAD-dependent aldehyde dehydrogenase